MAKGTLDGMATIPQLCDDVLNVILHTPGMRDRKGLPAILWGGPGTAKTQKVEDFCRRNTLGVQSLSPAEGEAAYGITPAVRQIAEAQIKRHGLEKMVNSGALTNLCIGSPPPEWALSFLSPNADGVLFFDDISWSPPIIQAAQLNALTHGRIAGHTLGKGVRCIGAANPIDGGGGFSLSPALANRALHLWVNLETRELVEHILNGMAKFTGPSEEVSDDVAAAAKSSASYVDRALRKWPRAFAESRALFAAFLKKNPHSVKQPSSDSENAGRAWPSGRTVELAIRAWAGCEVFNVEDLRLPFVAGACGDGFAKEFVQYSRNADLPDVYAILNGEPGASWIPVRNRVDVAHIVLSTAAAMTCDESDRVKKSKYADRTWDLINTAIEASVPTDCVFGAAKKLVKNRLFAVAAQKPLTALQPLFVAAKVIVPKDDASQRRPAGVSGL